jgi:signal transduction histidine kinase
MNAVGTAWSNPQRLTRVMSLRQLEWAAILAPLAFLGVYYYLMVGPLHMFFHSWIGFAVLLGVLAVAVWVFSRTVFGAFRGLQAEIEALHEQTQALVVEQERHHIAREMHDGLAQILSFVNTKAQAVEQFLDRGDYEAARGHNAELAAAARKVYSDIREGIVALRVEVGGERSLREIFDEYVAEFSEFSRLPVEIVWDIEEDELELAPVVEVQVLRIVQEALTNVRRHASAGQARVTFASDDGTLEISISDDGQGFDPGSIARGEWPQFGLRSMHERAEAAGGTLEVESELGVGTTIRAKFPGVVRYATMAR